MAWARARSTSFTIGKVAQMRLLIVPIGRRPGRKRWNKAWCDSLNARCVVSYSARCDQSTFALWAWTWLAYLGHRCRKNLDWKRRLRNADERRSTQIRSASCQLISATSGYTRVCADQLGAGFHWALELGEFQWIPETGIAPSSDDRIRGSREWPCHHVGCNKSYGRRQEAIRHTRDKHEFSRTCFICDIKWTRADMIRKHLLFKHRHHFTEEELREIRQLQGLNNTIELLKRLEISKALEK